MTIISVSFFSEKSSVSCPVESKESPSESMLISNAKASDSLSALSTELNSSAVFITTVSLTKDFSSSLGIMDSSYFSSAFLISSFLNMPYASLV